VSSRAPAVLATVLVWLFLAVAPGLLVSSGTIGTIEADGNVTGAVFWSWMLGFLLSFAWLYVVEKAVGQTHRWWLVTGSMLPWLVDFSAAFSTGASYVFIGLTVLNGVAMVVGALRGAWIDHGERATATVVQVLPNLLHMNYVVNNVYVHRRVLVDVARPDGSHSRRKLGVLSEIGTSPAVGDTFQVVVDPDHPDRVSLAPTS
jgi:hypothetical protein